MITVNRFVGQHCQMYYLYYRNYFTGINSVWGPFSWDFDNAGVTSTELITKLDFGKPAFISTYDNLVDRLIRKDNHVIHGENSISHKNAKGTVYVNNGSALQGHFVFAKSLDQYSIDQGGAWWFFNETSSHYKNYVAYNTTPIGYLYGHSDFAYPRDVNIPSYLDKFYPANSSIVNFTDGDVSYRTTLPGPNLGSFSDRIQQTDSYKMKGGDWQDDRTVVFTNFRPPNIVDLVWKDKFGSVTGHTYDHKLIIVPCSRVGTFDQSYSEWQVTQLLNAPFSYIPHAHIPEGSLAQVAVESISYIESNSIENLAGWKDVKHNFPPLKALKNPMNPKNLASLYLWYKYSFLPNIKDVPAFLNAMAKAFKGNVDTKGYSTKYSTMFQTSDSPFGIVNTRANCRVRLRPQCYTEMQSLNGQLRSLGLNPSAANLWDLIPFSFVIDWFLPVGRFLSSSAYSTDVMLNQYDVYDYISSRKTTLVVDSSQLDKDFTGIVTYSQYDRQVTQSLPQNDFDFGSNDPLAHIFEGSALVVANW